MKSVDLPIYFKKTHNFSDYENQINRFESEGGNIK